MGLKYGIDFYIFYFKLTLTNQQVKHTRITAQTETGAFRKLALKCAHNDIALNKAEITKKIHKSKYKRDYYENKSRINSNKINHL